MVVEEFAGISGPASAEITLKTEENLGTYNSIVGARVPASEGSESQTRAFQKEQYFTVELLTSNLRNPVIVSYGSPRR
jgi:hypothetical protein